jgi:hypothetical protein
MSESQIFYKIVLVLEHIQIILETAWKKQIFYCKYYLKHEQETVLY